MSKLVECVPNFSEGRDAGVIRSIAAEIEAVSGVTLLDVDPGADTHRTVITFVGPPEAVVEAAFRAGKRAAETIDMTRHHGSHARMGAMDVCPFVPVAGVTMADCVELAQECGRRIGDLSDGERVAGLRIRGRGGEDHAGDPAAGVEHRTAGVAGPHLRPQRQGGRHAGT